MLLLLMPHATKKLPNEIINVVARRYATTKIKNEPARATTDENGKLNSSIT